MRQMPRSQPRAAEASEDFEDRRTRSKVRVPHISLVFREMWDTTYLNPKAFR